MANDKIVHLDQDNFGAEVMESQTPVLVDFWAPWCGPCRMVAPVLDELADELEGKVRIAKLNVDENQQLAMQYGVQSIPAFILFDKGEKVDQMLGALPKAAFEQMIERHAS